MKFILHKKNHLYSLYLKWNFLTKDWQISREEVLGLHQGAQVGSDPDALHVVHVAKLMVCDPRDQRQSVPPRGEGVKERLESDESAGVVSFPRLRDPDDAVKYSASPLSWQPILWKRILWQIAYYDKIDLQLVDSEIEITTLKPLDNMTICWYVESEKHCTLKVM